ncbi:MAG: outer membrane lipoprotein-sorting protein [Lentisphaerota bacterium]
MCAPLQARKKLIRHGVWRFILFCFLGIALPAVLAQTTETPGFYPDGESLMRKVIEAMPQTQMKVNADLQSKGKGGKTEQLLHVEMVMDWYAEEPMALYTIRDAFGTTLEALKMVRPALGEMETYYYKGDPLAGSPLPVLFDRIQQTDISWVDLSLSFLWWPHGKTTGSEKIKGRLCYIVEVPSPAPGPSNYGGVRLWIDPQVYVLLQAVALDSDKKEAKRLQVKSFKKINGVWMISDLEIQDLVSKHKTLLRVRQIDMKEKPPAQEEPAAPDGEDAGS